MRAFFVFLLCVGTATCFDFESVDATNANWIPCGSSVADITIKVTSRVPKLFDREDSFDYQYAGPKYIKDSKGRVSTHGVGLGPRTFPSFEANGNKGWIYVKEISADGVHIRCVVREKPDKGRVLYEYEFIIPWNRKIFSLHTDREQFDARIIANTNQ